MEVESIDAEALFNELQARKNWPSGGPPVLFDLRPAVAYATRHARGAHSVSLTADGEIMAPAKSWWDKPVCVYAEEEADGIGDHPVVLALQKDGQARRILALSEPYSAFDHSFPFLSAKGDSRSAAKRPPSYPSSILRNLLYLGDLEDAAALPRLRETINVRHCVTALADPPNSLKASVAESKAEHTWCNVRDVEQADIKEHFERAYDVIEKARAAGTAVLVHCSRGVSRSASLVIAYLMRKEQQSAEEARAFVTARRPIVLPNDGFWRCLQEYGKEISGQRTGVYVPRKTKAIEDLDFELPPQWAAEPKHTDALLCIEREGEELEQLSVGSESMYVFGRSLTCDFQLEHASASRQHAALVHHHNGGMYLIDLKSSHGSLLNGKPLKPHEAVRLHDGATIAFGASKRAYMVRIDSERAAAAAPSTDSAGPKTRLEAYVDRGEKRTAVHPKKWEKKKRKWLAGPKSSKQMSENDRVAKWAGGGSGCMGPGFD